MSSDGFTFSSDDHPPASPALVPAAKPSLNPTKSNRWPQPELSVGDFLGSMDLLSRYKCWEVKDQSPAHIVWKSLLKLVRDQYEHLNAAGENVLIDMFMVGRSEAKARPTILICCWAKPPRSSIQKTIEEKSLLCHYPGVLTAGCSRFPDTFRRGEKDIDDYFGSLNHEAQLPVRSISSFLPELELGCGISVTVLAREHSTSRKPTLGGTIEADGKLYELTTTHSFFEINQNKSLLVEPDIIKDSISVAVSEELELGLADRADYIYKWLTNIQPDYIVM